MGQISLAELTEIGIIVLYGEPEMHFFSSEHSPLTYMLIYIFSYLYHGQWTAQIAFDLVDRMGFYSLTSWPTVMMNNFGLIDLGQELKAFSDTGAFISLPGALYYDFGWFGVFFGTLILGFLWGILMIFIKSRGRLGVFKIVFIISILYILILSPIIPAYGLSYFFFILWAFFLLTFLNALLYKRKIYFG